MLARTIREVCSVAVEDDGVAVLADTLSLEAALIRVRNFVGRILAAGA